MQKKRYVQPGLQLVSLELSDVLLVSSADPDDPNDELEKNFTVHLGKTTWQTGVWN